MLVQSQREILSKLKNGEIEDDDYLKIARRSMRKYVIRQLDSMADLLEVMKVLGPDQLGWMGDKGQIGPGHINAAADLLSRLAEIVEPGPARSEYLAPLLDVVDKYLEFVDPWPIGESEEGELLSIKTFAKRSGEPGKCWVESRYMDALTEEIETWKRLKEHAAHLQYFTDPYLISPNAPPDGIREWFDRERLHRQFVTGTNYFTRWRDEEGIGRAAPALVDEEEIRRHKRWNPRPLPVKYEVAEDQRSVSPLSEK